MKRKPNRPHPVVAPEIPEGGRRSLPAEGGKAPTKCVVCGSETTSGADEPLCWVCRRLKISAWREVEQQIPAQE